MSRCCSGSMCSPAGTAPHRRAAGTGVPSSLARLGVSLPAEEGSRSPGVAAAGASPAALGVPGEPAKGPRKEALVRVLSAEPWLAKGMSQSPAREGTGGEAGGWPPAACAACQGGSGRTAGLRRKHERSNVHHQI